MAIITNANRGGLVGVVGDASDNQYAVESNKGFVFLSKEQIADARKAITGDTGANDRLKAQGFKLRLVTPEVAAQDRVDLASGAREKFNNDKANQDKFIKQMNDLGGNHQTWAQALRVGLDRNANGTVPLQGKDGKTWQLTRNDGKSPTADDIRLGMKAASGDAAAQEQAKGRGLLVAPPKNNAAAVFEPTTAGALSANTRV